MESQLNTQPSGIPVAPTESESLGELFGALCKAQSEMEMAKNDSRNPYFKSKYADLASVVNASRKALTKNGLSVIQRVLPNGGEVSYMHTRLCHASGEWIESKMPITPPKNDIQSIGGYMTYLRRYTYASIVGVVSVDEDDDGESVVGRETKESHKIPEKEKEKISIHQLTVLAEELKGEEDLLEELLTHLKIKKLSDVPPSKYQKILDHVKKVKAVKEENSDNI